MNTHNNTIKPSKGVSLPITTIVIITIAIIVLLALIAFFSSSWHPEPINETAGDARDEWDGIEFPWGSNAMPCLETCADERATLLKRVT